jgi:hypothetical protein
LSASYSIADIKSKDTPVLGALFFG